LGNTTTKKTDGSTDESSKLIKEHAAAVKKTALNYLQQDGDSFNFPLVAGVEIHK
jgi:hypothetical protein